MKLKGKVAVVTGGARGNGFAAARCLAEEGADIAIADICANMATIPYAMSTPEVMDRAVADIKSMGRKAIGIRCDVRKAADVKAMVDQVMSTFTRIDVLVNNAGNSSMVAIADMDEATWDAVLDTHLKGTYLCCHYVLPHMIRQHSGAIVNISSVGGQRGFGMGGHYCAAKHGIIGLQQVHRHGGRRSQHPRQRGLPRHGLDGHDEGDRQVLRHGRGGGQGAVLCRPSDQGKGGDPRRHRPGRPVACVRRLQMRHGQHDHRGCRLDGTGGMKERR
ncbi:MAG: SDR family NAD(P)-dependent oxidoreductase [Desulfobacterales bacterium]|nr:SDR family NAD(P)-dependent oxidoreductase [Desulfobacterales bacterium]